MRTTLTTIFACFGGILFAQDTLTFPDATDFYKSLLGKSKSKSIQWNGQNIQLNLYKQSTKQILGRTQSKESMVVINQGKSINGFIITSKSKNEAIKIESNNSNELLFTKAKADDFLCVNYNVIPTNKPITPQLSNITAPASWDPKKLESRPGAVAVIYCDFDGYNLPAGTPWNNGAALNAAASGYDEMDVLMAWNVLVEDYAPFDVNVTTDIDKYNAAPNGKKTRVVFTPTSYWSQGGGVALLNSFNWQQTTVCWVFTDGFQSSVSAAEAGSHEAGHTLGLKHDGQGVQEYYRGHKPWAPIMGASYYEPLTHWSVGDYNGATNQQQDLDIIESAIGGYRPDDHGNTLVSASEINYDLVNGIAELSKANKGVIEKRTDIDLFHFYLAGGQINIDVTPTGLPKPNLDLEVKLLDDAGNTILTNSHGHDNFTNSVNINKVLAGGDYYIQVDGIGTGNATTGWTDYSSLGQYKLEGTIEGIEQKDYDAALMNINNVGAKTCGSSLKPQLEILNAGKKDMLSVHITAYVNNQPVHNQTYFVNMNSGATKLVDLDLPISNFGDGNLKIELSMPNGQTDQIQSNNSASVSYNINPGQLFEFKISQQSLEPNMNWTITSNGSPITNDAAQTTTSSNNMRSQSFCLENDKCYDFEITNAFLQDLCNQYPAWDAGTIYAVGDQCVYQGRIYEATTQIWAANPVDYAHYYKDLGPCPEPNQQDYFELQNVTQGTNIAQQTVAEYSNTFSKNFCLSDVTSTPNLNSMAPRLYPNPFGEQIRFTKPIQSLSVYNSFGQLIHRQNTTKNSISTGNWPSGVYHISYVLENHWHHERLIKK